MDRSSSLTRRRLLASAAALAGVGLGAPAVPQVPATAPAGLSFHLVDGWILTNRDLEALGLDAD